MKYYSDFRYLILKPVSVIDTWMRWMAEDIIDDIL